MSQHTKQSQFPSLNKQKSKTLIDSCLLSDIIEELSNQGYNLSYYEIKLLKFLSSHVSSDDLS